MTRVAQRLGKTLQETPRKPEKGLEILNRNGESRLVQEKKA